MLKKGWILLGALILIISAIAFFYLYQNVTSIEGEVIKIEKTVSTPPIIEVSEPEPPVEEPKIPVKEPEPIIPSTKEFHILAKRFEFIPGTITVNQGDTVIFTVTSVDVSHGFLISEYDINEKLRPNQPVTIEFTADKKGTFPIICNVPCGSGHKSMRGTLVVN